ncbi:MAG: regulatory protein MarR [Bacteroidota bacterium]|nr:regulatory protein MarR [Bacteroidota bacterium]
MPSIEQILKQNKFKSEKERAIVSILFANNLINGFYEEIFKKHGLTIQQYNALRILRGQFPNPCTINLIRERMLDKMSDASRIVERLRKAGWAERVTSAKDRRAVDVIITGTGLELLGQIDKLQNDFDHPAVKLSEKEARQLGDLLEKVFDSLMD